MPYWVTCNGKPVLSFNHQNAAWLYIEKQEALWRSQGFAVPVYRVYYGAQEQHLAVK